MNKVQNNKPTTVIFLDIDGVVTTARGGWFNMDIIAINFLLFLCEASGAQIVISSTWRHNHKRPFWKPIFGKHLHRDWATPVTRISRYRGQEIAAWLKKHPEVTKYIILDDDSDMLPEQKPFFVQTDGVDGLLTDAMMKARELLGVTTFSDDLRKPHIHKNMFGYENFKIYMGNTASVKGLKFT